MKTIVLIAAVVGGALSATVPALAQKTTTLSALQAPDNGEPKPATVPTNGHLSDAERARLTALAYATCLVEKHRKQARQIVDLQPFSDESRIAFAKLMTSDCLSNASLRMAAIAARAALFQALYRADFASSQPDLLPSPVSFPIDRKDGDAAVLSAMLSFADCVVRSNASAVRTLLLAQASSEREMKAYSVLAPSFGNCLPAGSQVHLNKSIVNGALAEALYRESVASRDGGPGANQ